MEEVLSCPGCNGTDLDFAKLPGPLVRCFACRALVRVDEKRVIPDALDEGVVELRGTVVDARAMAAAPEFTELGGGSPDSFPVDLYVSDGGFVCIRNWNEVVTLTPEQAAGLARWLPVAILLAQSRHPDDAQPG